MIRHVILTRFNIASEGRESRIRARPDWLKGRFELFERYCLPSLAAQTDPDFGWIVLFDDQTEDWARRRIEKLRNVVPFHAVFTPWFHGRKWAAFTRLIIGEPQAGRTIITSNLDNDDGLACDYVERLKRVARATRMERPYAINFENGLVLDQRGGYWHRHRHSAFVNVVEDDTPALSTANHYDHMALPTLLPVVQESGPPAWLQVVHGGNVSNKIRGRLLRRIDESWFPPVAVAPNRPVSYVRLTLENGLLQPVRKARDWLIGLLRPLIRKLR